MKIIQFIAILLLFSLSACEKTLDYAINDTPVIVVNSFISPSEPITVNLSQSILITEADTIKKLSNAIVWVYCDNVYKEELKYIKAGVYQSSFRPEANKTYFIAVNPRTASFVGAQTNVPEKPKIVSFVVDSFRSERCNLRAKLTIKDDASIKNYYCLTLKGSAIKYKLTTDTIIDNGIAYYNQEWVPNGDTLSTLLFINNDKTLINKGGTSSSETVDAIFGNTEVGPDNLKWLAFADNTINGTIHTIELYINATINASKPIYVELKSINKDYYYYLKSKYSADKTSNSAFSEPVKVYNNITGGAGILGAFNLAVDSVTSVKAKKQQTEF